VQHANPLHTLYADYDGSNRVRRRAESAIVVCLAGREAQQRHSPRSWRAHHSASNFKQAVDLASGFNGSDEAVHAYLDWLAIVTRDEIAVLWPHVENGRPRARCRQTLSVWRRLLCSWRGPSPIVAMRNLRVSLLRHLRRCPAARWYRRAPASGERHRSHVDRRHLARNHIDKLLPSGSVAVLIAKSVHPRELVGNREEFIRLGEASLTRHRLPGFSSFSVVGRLVMAIE
jgi:hypothetical protein